MLSSSLGGCTIPSRCLSTRDLTRDELVARRSLPAIPQVRYALPRRAVLVRSRSSITASDSACAAVRVRPSSSAADAAGSPSALAAAACQVCSTRSNMAKRVRRVAGWPALLQTSAEHDHADQFRRRCTPGFLARVRSWSEPRRYRREEQRFPGMRIARLHSRAA